jgi:hypothetical protein
MLPIWDESYVISYIGAVNSRENAAAAAGDKIRSEGHSD